MSDVPIGGVTVEIKGQLLPLEQAFASGKAQSVQFEQQASAGATRVAASVTKAGQAIQASGRISAKAEEELAAAIAGTGHMSAATVKELGGLDAVQRRIAESSDKATAAINRQKAAWLEQGKAARAAQQAAQRNAQFSSSTYGIGGAPKSAEDSAAVFGGGKAPPTRGQIAGRINLARQAPDVLVSGAMGMNPAMIAIQQGPQILDALAMSGIKVTAAMGLVAGSIVAVGVATVGAVVLLEKYNRNLAEMGALSQGVGVSAGLSAQALDSIAHASAAASNTTVGSARDLEKALLKTGSVGGEVFAGLIANQKKYANATGQDLKGAQAEIAGLFADPAKGADILFEKFGKMSVAQRDAIKDAANHGDQLKSQKLLAEAFAQSVGGVSNSLGGMKGFIEGSTSALSRFFDTMGAGLKVIDEFQHKGPKGVQDMITGAADAQRRANADAAMARARTNTGAGVDLARELNPDFKAKQGLESARGVLGQGMADAKKSGQPAALNEITKAYENVTRAQATYLDQSVKEHQLSELDAQANAVRSEKQTAATRAKLGDIAAQRVRIQMAGQVMSSAEVEQRARDAADQASAKGSRSVDAHAAALARDAAAMEANAAGAVRLANAYLQGGAAAQKAESRRKAETSAASKGIDVEAEARRQLSLDTADQAAAGAKLTAATKNQTDAQLRSNLAVLRGEIGAGEAAKLMQQELMIKPLQNAADIAEGKTKETLIRIIERLRDAYVGLNAAELDTQMAAAHQDARWRLKMLELEATLLGKTNPERDRELAILAKRQELFKQGGQPLVDSPEGQQAMDDAGKLADANNTNDAAKYIQAQTDAVGQQTDALRDNAAAIGMTYEQAAIYLKEQQLLEEAGRRHITLTEKQRDAIHDLATGYGQAADASRKLTEQQKAAADAAGFMADEVERGISDILWEGKSAKAALADMIKDYGKARLQSFLTGRGPLAGIMGTDKTEGPGKPNGGILSKVFGKAFGVGNAPDGTANNPLHVMFAGGGLGTDGAAGKDSLFGKLFSGGANDNGPIDDSGAAVSVDFDKMGGGFLDKFSSIFKTNTDGGLTGGLSKLFGSGGILKGLAGGIGKFLTGGGGGGGGAGGFLSSAGHFLASVFHDGTSSVGGGIQNPRSVSSSLFLNAPRLHDGLNPGEFPAILQEGEGVTSRAQNAAHGRTRGGGVTMIVKTNDADSFRRGKRQIYQALNRKMKSAA